MKVAIIDKEAGFGIDGIAIYNQRLYQYLTQNNHQVTILRFTKKKHKDKYIYQIPYYLAEKRTYVWLPSEKTLSIVRNYLQKIKPDVVYISAGNSLFDFFLPGLCHELKIPIIGVWHGDFNTYISSIQLLLKSLFLAYLPFAKQLDMIHVFSHNLKIFFLRKRIPEKKIFVLPNGVDTDFYKPGESSFAEQNNIKTGILFLGRITYQKNPEILIKSFLEINPPNNTKLIFVGSGELEHDLHKRFRDKRIIFTGLIKEEKKKLDIMRACQIFVQPSRFEGMSLALLEAMSCGLACVASDVGANSELLVNSGILIPTMKLTQQLSLALHLLIKYPEFAKILGKKAQAHVINNHSNKMILKHLTEKFKQVVEEYKRTGIHQT